MIFALSILACGVAIAGLSNLSLWVERWQTRREREAEENDAAIDRATPRAVMGRAVASLQTRVTLANKKEEEHRAKERQYWRKQLIEAHRLNFITGFGTIAAGVGLLFVWQSLIASRESTVENNRAWIAPNSFSFLKPIDGPDPFEVAVGYINLGKDPATNVSEYAAFDTLSDKLVSGSAGAKPAYWTDSVNSLQNTCDINLFQSPTSIAYGNKDWAYAFNVSKPKYIKVPEIQSGAVDLIVHGCFRYDTFSDTHYTVFCDLLFFDKDTHVTDGQFHICPTGSFTD